MNALFGDFFKDFFRPVKEEITEKGLLFGCSLFVIFLAYGAIAIVMLFAAWMISKSHKFWRFLFGLKIGDSAMILHTSMLAKPFHHEDNRWN
jgi:hypothetical protein